MKIDSNSWEAARIGNSVFIVALEKALSGESLESMQGFKPNSLYIRGDHQEYTEITVNDYLIDICIDKETTGDGHVKVIGDLHVYPARFFGLDMDDIEVREALVCKRTTTMIKHVAEVPA